MDSREGDERRAQQEMEDAIRRVFVERIKPLEAGALESLRQVDAMEQTHKEMLGYLRYRTQAADHVQTTIREMRDDAHRMLEEASQLRKVLGLPPRHVE